MVVYRFQKDSLSLSGHPAPLRWVQSLRSRMELEYSLTLRTLYVNAALRVAIDRFQCIREFPTRFVSIMNTDDSRHNLLFAAKVTPSLGLTDYYWHSPSQFIKL